MKVAFFGFLLSVVNSARSSDLSCTLQGGTCLDYRYYFCTAGFEQGLCDGDSNRKCCLECDQTCLSEENQYAQCCDSECTNDGGKCQLNSNYCSGSYATGKCGGPYNRQCCSTSSTGSSSNTGCYGDIEKVDTTGASSATASQDNLYYSGVPASRKMAEYDLTAMSQYKTKIVQAGEKLCADPAIIAGIISRETRAGKVLGSDGFGSDGHGYGLMQVDDRYHTLKGGPYSLEHIEQGTGILIDMINGVEVKHRDWTQDMALKGGICAYNSGVSNVQTYENMDVGTTGNDYSNDVTARSQYYKENGY
ncbi:unnamed protein product [Clavelina lepadiformis]|uniref:Lysozyme n=1 Tax=Clavelina lepadiformis TaxID=159417 RepID=A0ABP0F2D8_CLALP